METSSNPDFNVTKGQNKHMCLITSEIGKHRLYLKTFLHVLLDTGSTPLCGFTTPPRM